MASDEEDSDALSQCSHCTGEEPKTPVTREDSESLNLIDMDDGTIKGGPTEASAPNQRKKGSVTMPESTPFEQTDSTKCAQRNAVNVNSEQQQQVDQEKQTAGRVPPMNLTNPLVIEGFHI